MKGSPINSYAIPEAFWVWYDELLKKWPYVTIEISRQEIVVCRCRKPIESERSAIKNVPYCKVIRDESGVCMERTFRPRYMADLDKVESVV